MTINKGSYRGANTLDSLNRLSCREHTTPPVCRRQKTGVQNDTISVETLVGTEVLLPLNHT